MSHFPVWELVSVGGRAPQSHIPVPPLSAGSLVGRARVQSARHLPPPPGNPLLLGILAFCF